MSLILNLCYFTMGRFDFTAERQANRRANNRMERDWGTCWRSFPSASSEAFGRRERVSLKLHTPAANYPKDAIVRLTIVR
jgi:hypothetical protein